jgi:hypothetical protein
MSDKIRKAWFLVAWMFALAMFAAGWYGAHLKAEHDAARDAELRQTKQELNVLKEAVGQLP